MKTRGLETVLREHRFFEGMSDEHLTLLAGCAKNVNFEVGKKLFRYGEDANHFFIVREGRVSVQIEAPDRDVIQIQTLGAGNVLGWSWLFPPYKWSFDAEAVEPVRAISLDGKCLRGKCEDDPVLGYDLMQRFCAIVVQRLEATRGQVLDMYGANPESVASL